MTGNGRASAANASQSATVEGDEAGQRLDRWFKRRYPALGHGALEKLLRTGQVRVDGKRAHAGDRLEAGQVLRIPPQLQSTAKTDVAPRPASSDADLRLMQSIILHEDP